MIRAVYRNGLIYPAEPVPPAWSDGQEVRVEWDFAEPSDDPAEIERWDEECRRVGPFQHEPGQREREGAVLEEADALAKACVRRRMESGK
jgi:hypothetical protein